MFVITCFLLTLAMVTVWASLLSGHSGLWVIPSAEDSQVFVEVTARTKRDSHASEASFEATSVIRLAQ